MGKSFFYIYIKNFIAFIIFSILKIFFKTRKRNYSKSIIFINSGQIGDILVSSLILENEDFFDEYNSLCFLIKKDYLGLFHHYNGKFEIIGYDSYKYKYSILYKIKLLKFLSARAFEKCFNLTAARGIINDELAILTGAREVFCLNSNWKYLKKLFGKRIEKYYTKVLSKSTFNEYEKHLELLREFNSDKVIAFNNNYLFNFNKQLTMQNEKIIIIAPFSSVRNRDWPIKNYQKLLSRLGNKYKILLLGDKNQEKDLNMIAKNIRNVEVLAGKLKYFEIPQIMMKAKIFIGVDSGLSHIALKLNLQTIVILGGGQYGRFLPFNYDNSTKIYFLAYPLDCFGCEWNCILDEKECINIIGVEEVASLALKLIEE